MTDEELLKYIKEKECYIIPKNNFVIDGVDVSEAVGKQIPKKPRWDNIYYCGRCGGIICANAESMPYCHECGQRIDWSDTK